MITKVATDRLFEICVLAALYAYGRSRPDDLEKCSAAEVVEYDRVKALFALALDAKGKTKRAALKRLKLAPILKDNRVRMLEAQQIAGEYPYLWLTSPAKKR